MNTVIENAGFHHVALASNCFNETIAFYEGLGFNKIAEWGEEPKRAAMLDIGNGDIFEIFSDGVKEVEQNSRFFHLAIKTNDPDGAYNAAIKLGAISKSEPKDFDIQSTPVMKVRIAFVYGLSGEVLEFFKYR